jgi:hypothetical protein
MIEVSSYKIKLIVTDEYGKEHDWSDKIHESYYDYFDQCVTELCEESK